MSTGPSVSLASVRLTAMLSGMPASAAPEAAIVDSRGASATGLTVTVRSVLVDAVGPLRPSWEAAVTVSVKSASEFAGGVILRLDRVHELMLTDVWPIDAVKV